MRPPIAFAAAMALAGLVLSPLAYAENTDAIQKRKALMEANGRAAKEASQMIKGEKPYDAAAALKIFTTINSDTKTFATLFPEDSKTGAKTEASPAIWEKPDAFKAANDKMIADSQAGIDAKPQDLEAFKAAFGKVAANCSGCHKQFRT